jgi:hypothetical protein
MNSLPASPPSSGPSNPALSLLPAQLAVAARLLVDVLSQESSWLRRRVETVAFEGDVVQRRISLDADVPAAEQQVPIPIALFGKEQTIVNVDVRDEEGRALPLLTRSEGTAVGYVALQLAIAEAGEKLTSEEDDLVLDVATGSPQVGLAAYERLIEIRPSWLDREPIRPLVELLTRQVILFALLDSRGGRRVVRFAWEEVVLRDRGPRGVLEELLGFGGRLLVTSNGLPSSASSHFEVVAPYGTEISSATMLGRGEDAVEPSRGGRRAHLYLPQPAEGFRSREVLIRLQPAASLVALAAGAAGFVLVLLTIAAVLPALRDSQALFLGLLAGPVAVVAREAAVVRGNRTGFASPLVFGPLLVTLVPAVLAGAYVVATSAEYEEPGLYGGASLSLVSLLALLGRLRTIRGTSGVRDIKHRESLEPERRP